MATADEKTPTTMKENKEITEQSDAERKLRAAASAAARAVPEDQIEDVIKWTEHYLETLKVRTLVFPPNNMNQLTSKEDK